ncbi:MAG: OpgC family protein [Bosea sp. (in: a-proteobacteria)]
MTPYQPTPASTTGARKPRDLRLDLARGLTMLIILVAHIPANAWAEFIPARMGFSSGAEAFVLCSGLASGLAFGGVYSRKGWGAGTSRIARRVGQLWLIQMLAFAGFAALLLSLDRLSDSTELEQRYALSALIAAPAEMVAALATLRYVPIYFDILPLYIVLLAATPLVVLLAKNSPRLLLGIMSAFWLMAQTGQFNLPANPLTGAGWYFNPLAWQFLFFAGFGMTAGWFPVPRRTPFRMALALVIVIGSVPLTFWPFHDAFPMLGDAYTAIYPADAITRLHPLRLIHVLALAWLFAKLLEGQGEMLSRPVVAPLIAVGQQALPTFIAGVFLSALGGVALDHIGRGDMSVAVVNLTGMALLVLVAYVARSSKRLAAGFSSSTLQNSHLPPPLQKEPKSCPVTPI